ncbi:hypothetical protein MY11210_005115 [Beauveria gryllotalpidicola]
MSSQGGASFVRYFFYKGYRLEDRVKQQAVALAYATARELKLAPSMILIRAGLHRTTSIAGKHVLDPDGWHLTMAFKDQELEARGFHVASHGYTNGQQDYVLDHGTHTAAKRDDTPRGPVGSGKVVWPDESELVEYENSPIAYSHLTDPSSKE